MIVAFDVKGTLDAWPKQLGEIMTALKAAENEIIVLTGVTTPHVAPSDITTAKQYLLKIGITTAMYDRLVVCPAPHPKSKAAAVKQYGIQVLIDNKEATAKKASKQGALCLVPWSTAEK